MSEMDRVLNRLDKVLDGMADIREELGRNSAQHESMTERMDAIHAQTTKTNGRVTVLESRWAKVTGMAIASGGLFSLALKLML